MVHLVPVRVRAAKIRNAPLHGVLLLALAASAGCANTYQYDRYRTLERGVQSVRATPLPEADATSPFPGVAELQRAALVRAVLERNTTIRSAQHAWRAAVSRYPQAVALDDPVIGYGLAPRSLGSNSVDSAYKIDFSQRIPFPGKLALRGQTALAEAEAARHDFEAVRLRLATIASLLLDDYYLLARSLEINAEHVALLEELQVVATARYAAGEVSQQDPLQAETELAHLLHQEVVLQTRLHVTRQQLNTLLHRHPELSLPAPPDVLDPPGGDPSAYSVDTIDALQGRPELRAAEARIEARRASAGLARREFLPDFTLVGSYNTLWQDPDLQPYVGISINIPLQLSRRRAALEEANANLARAESDRQGIEDSIRLDVETALTRLAEAKHVLRLFEERLLPAVKDRIAAARAGFETGRDSFLVLIDAERDLRTTELGREEARAEFSRRSAELLRATGSTEWFTK